MQPTPQDKYQKGAKPMTDPLKWQKIKIQYFNGVTSPEDLKRQIQRNKPKINHAR